jgi:DNA repair photolyase
MSNSLQPYYGEFLVSPVPLELDMNYCSHLCGYCFANLNRRDRKINLTQITNLLNGFEERETLEAKLLKERYPVMISNHVDPFAASNYQQTIPLLELLRYHGIPVTIQTRGGRGIDEALELLEPSVWYISITFNDDAARRIVEPGAPTIQSRLELISKLRERGHRVVVGINPLEPEWMPDPASILNECASRGAEGAWIESLHLNPKQRDQMTPREQNAIGETIITRALRHTRGKIDAATAAHFEFARAHASSLGMEVFSIGQPDSTDFFKPWRDVYPKTFPIIQDFVNEFNKLERGALLTWDDFWRALTSQAPFPAIKARMSHYVGSSAHDILATHQFPPTMTYKQLVSVMYQDSRAKQCPARNYGLAFAAEWDGDGWFTLVDEQDRPYLVTTVDQPNVWQQFDTGGR